MSQFRKSQQELALAQQNELAAKLARERDSDAQQLSVTPRVQPIPGMRQRQHGRGAQGETPTGRNQTSGARAWMALQSLLRLHLIHRHALPPTMQTCQLTLRLEGTFLRARLYRLRLRVPRKAS